MLVPFSPITVSDGKNHPLWFTFYVPPGTPAGDYAGNLTFTTYREFDDGVSPTQTFNISVYMHVWDFRLPTIPTLPTNFGLSLPFNTTLYNQTLEVFAQHSMMDWAFAPMPTVINLTSMGDIDTIDFTAMDAIYNYYHSFDTHSFGLFFSPSDASSNN